MPTTKEYNLRLTRLRSTRKITNTMKLVSVNKLRRAQGQLGVAEVFWHELDRAAKLAKGKGSGPLCEPREPVRRALVLLVTSDRGLCGGFNHNLQRLLVRWLRDNGKHFEQVSLSFYGRRGHLFFKSRATVHRYYAGLSMRPAYLDAMRISEELQRQFLSRQQDAIWVAYNRLMATGVSQPVVEPFLPCPAEPADRVPAEPADRVLAEPGLSSKVLVEPTPQAVGRRLAVQQAHLRLFGILLQNAAGEQRARMVAMDSATRNVDSLMDTYTLLRNRARQAGITRELIEIVGGAEAMRTGSADT